MRKILRPFGLLWDNKSHHLGVHAKISYNHLGVKNRLLFRHIYCIHLIDDSFNFNILSTVLSIAQAYKQVYIISVYELFANRIS